MKRPKILAMAGSARKDSFNKKLIKIAAASARDAGAEVTLIDLADYRLPLYDGDLEAEQGLPQKASELKKLFREHDGFIFSSPEYNSSVSGVFKNVIDWISRPEKDDPFYLCAYKGKMAALLSASPGALGGLRGLVALRSLLENIYVMVLPDQITIANAAEAFDEKGEFKDPKQKKKVVDLMQKFIHVVHSLEAEKV